MLTKMEPSNDESSGHSLHESRQAKPKKGRKRRLRSKRLASLRLVDDFEGPESPKVSKHTENEHVPLIEHHEEEEKYELLQPTRTAESTPLPSLDVDENQDLPPSRSPDVQRAEALCSKLPKPVDLDDTKKSIKSADSKDGNHENNENRSIQDPSKPINPKRESVDDSKENDEVENQNIENIKVPPKPTKYPVVSSANELEIDPSDIMDPVELLKRRVDDMFAENRSIEMKQSDKAQHRAHPGGAGTKTEGFQCSESYLETKSSKFVRLLSQKNIPGTAEGDEYSVYNPNLIADDNVMFTLQNEMMSIFTLIVGIVEGVGLLTLFVAMNNENEHFLQRFASLLYIIQFLSYIVDMILIPFCFILLNYRSDHKVISMQHKGLFICCSVGVFICGMIEFPISDEIYFLYEQDNDHFVMDNDNFMEQSNVDKLSAKMSRWRKAHFAQFCLLSVIWILCIGFMHRGKSSDVNKTAQKKNE